MKIGFCYNVLNDDQGGIASELDYDLPVTIQRIADTITGLGHEVSMIEADADAFNKLSQLKGEIDLVFNIAEGLWGDARESQIPMICEILKIPYTHSTPTIHAVKLNKQMSKVIVKDMGISVPGGIVVTNGKKPVDVNLNYPLIIKPNREGSSVGVFADNVVTNPSQMNKRLAILRKQGLKGELLIEEYIEGREFTVAVLGNYPPKVLPIIEQKFDFLPPELPKIAGFELKWIYEDKLEDLSKAYDCPAILPPEKYREIEDATLKIYQGMEIQDCARIDYRLRGDGTLYFIEINTLPGINPNPNVISYFPLAAKKAGIEYPQLIEMIITNASKRWNLKIHETRQ